MSRRREREERGRYRDEKEKKVVYTATYKVQRGDLLLEFLLRKCRTSRNNVKGLLARKQVLVNGSVVTQFDFPLAKDDEVKIAKTSQTDEKVTRAPVKNVKKVAPKTVKIIYEDEDFLAIDKPCGLLSVESDTDRESAYLYAVEYLKEKGKNIRPYVLHRIDKETSGVLVFAKNIKIHSMMRMRWNELVSKREYFAVIEGCPEKAEDTLVCYLKENKNRLMYATNDPSGQKAVTKYEVKEKNDEYALLRVEIETGRKNQIRAQMQRLGTPVVGDDKYGGEKDPLKRLGLHASRLSFLNPRTKEEITIVAPMPSVFRELFAKK